MSLKFETLLHCNLHNFQREQKWFFFLERFTFQHANVVDSAQKVNGFFFKHQSVNSFRIFITKNHSLEKYSSKLNFSNVFHKELPLFPLFSKALVNFTYVHWSFSKWKLKNPCTKVIEKNIFVSFIKKILFAV